MKNLKTIIFLGALLLSKALWAGDDIPKNPPSGATTVGNMSNYQVNKSIDICLDDRSNRHLWQIWNTNIEMKPWIIKMKRTKLRFIDAVRSEEFAKKYLCGNLEEEGCLKLIEKIDDELQYNDIGIEEPEDLTKPSTCRKFSTELVEVVVANRRDSIIACIEKNIQGSPNFQKGSMHVFQLAIWIKNTGKMYFSFMNGDQYTMRCVFKATQGLSIDGYDGGNFQMTLNIKITAI